MFQNRCHSCYLLERKLLRLNCRILMQKAGVNGSLLLSDTCQVSLPRPEHSRESASEVRSVLMWLTLADKLALRCSGRFAEESLEGVDGLDSSEHRA